ncbi:hypothetical protein ACRALDRAFT_2026286 [Sodiomyces alcalophilus JCM 7366]|uniref:uncharacterized protein n=1 Tax=Sodiomyces alcalophilus JCM 7366 TaxID=591952 RepID=UPI0039B532BB
MAKPPQWIKPTDKDDDSHPLQGFVVLLVAPFLSYEGIQALRATSTSLRDILDRYERSIALEHFARHWYEVQPRHLILSSETPTRYVIAFPSYAAIREFEGRARTIHYLIHHTSYLSEGYSCAGLGQDCTPEEMAYITQGLERALWLCSHIADLEAASWSSLDDVPESRRLDQHIVGDRCHECEEASDATTAGEKLPAQNPVRAAQLEIIKSLPTVDLARLVVLLFLVRHGLMGFLIDEGRDDDVELHICQAWCTSAAEATLRHGAFFLHSQIQGGNKCLLDAAEVTCPVARRVAELVSELVEEIHQWERGDSDMLPGLNMTVQGTFRKRVGCDVEHSLHFAAQLVSGQDVKCDHCKKVIASA